jgi:branched-chain amino acid transport system ATP-binding protein
VELALEVADYAYVLQTGRTVLEGPSGELAGDRDVQRIYRNRPVITALPCPGRVW